MMLLINKYQLLNRNLYSTLLLLESNLEGGLSKSNLALFKAAEIFNESIDGIIAMDVKEAYAPLKKLYTLPEAKTSEELSKVISNLKTKYTRIIGLHTSFGKSIIPRIAAKWDCACLTDVTSIDSNDVYQRPTYAGNYLLI